MSYKGFILKTSIMDILAMGASISTMIGLVIAIITLRYLYVEKKEKIEYEVKRNFFDGKQWTNEGDVYAEDITPFVLNIGEAPLHRFSGEIECSDEEKLTFYFVKSSRKKIILRVHRQIGWRDIGSATAKLKYMSPDLFQITFSKGKGTKESRFMPSLPKKTLIWSVPTSTP